MFSKEVLIKFLEDLFNGVDPYTGEMLEENNFLNNPDALRKLNAIILELNKDSKQVEDNSFQETKEETLVTKERAKIDDIVEPCGVYISHFLSKVNEVRIEEGKRKICFKKIGDLLLEEGYVYFLENGRRVPTLKGEECGMLSVYREVRGKSFYTIEYNMFAQKELIKLIKKHFN